MTCSSPLHENFTCSIQVAPLSASLIIFACIKVAITLSTDLGYIFTWRMQLQNYIATWLGMKPSLDSAEHVRALLKRRNLAAQNGLSESLCLLLAFVVIIVDEAPFGAPCSLTCTLAGRVDVLVSHFILLGFKIATIFIVECTNMAQMRGLAHKLNPISKSDPCPSSEYIHDHVAANWRLLLLLVIVTLCPSIIYTALNKYRLHLTVAQCNATAIPQSHLNFR